MNYKLYILILVRFSIIHGEEIQIAEETRPFVEYRKLCDTLNNLTVCGHLNAGAVLTPVVTLLLKGPCTRAAGRGVSLRAPKNLQFNYTLVMPVNTGSAGQALITDGNGNLSFGSPGSLSTAYIDGGNNFGADATVGLTSNNNLDIITTNTPRVRVSSTGDITLNSGKLFKLSNAGDTASVGLKAPAAIAADIILNLPDTAGAAGQFLQTDGANPATLTWANGGNVSGSGAANQVTYWSGANTITGSNNLTYNGTTTVTFGATGAFDSAGGITVSAPSGAGDALTVNANATDNSLVVTGGAGATAQTITAGTAQSGLAVTGDSATAVTISGGTGTKLAITGSGTNPAVTVAGNTLDMLGAKAVRFFNAGNTFSTGLVGGANVADATLTLPINVGTSGQFLQTNGASPAVLSWATGNTGSGTANQVARFSGTNTLAGSANFQYDGLTTITFSTQGQFASSTGVSFSAPSTTSSITLSVNAPSAAIGVRVIGGAGATAGTITAGTGQSALAVTGDSASAVTISGGTGTKLAITGGSGATAQTIDAGASQSALTITGNGTAVAASITAGSGTGGGLLITGGSGAGVPLNVTAAAGTGNAVTVTGGNSATAVTITPGTNRSSLTATGNGTANAVEITAGSGTGSGLLVTGGTGASALKATNTTTTFAAIDVSNTAGSFAAAPVNARLVCNGDLAVPNIATSFVNISDMRIKRNIVPVSSAASLERINNVQVKEFDLIENNTHTRGFVAQDFQKVYPEAVTITPEMHMGDQLYTNILSISPLVVVPDLVGAAQTLILRVQELKKLVYQQQQIIQKLEDIAVRRGQIL